MIECAKDFCFSLFTKKTIGKKEKEKQFSMLFKCFFYLKYGLFIC